MEKERVAKGKTYWTLTTYQGEIAAIETIDVNLPNDIENFKAGNYFPTKEEALNMIRKLNAVLKGADVIEMPSEEEIKSLFTCDYDSIYSCVFNSGRKDGIEWLKSKIMK